MATLQHNQSKITAYPNQLQKASVIALLCSTFLSGCIDTYGVRQLKLEKTDLMAMVESSELQIQKIEEKIAGLEARAEEPLAIRDWIEANLKERTEVQNRISELEEQLSDAISVLGLCQERFKAKSSLKLGTTFDTIILKNGRQLDKVTVTSFDGRKLSLTNSGGIANVTVAELPDKLAQLFVVPPGERIDIQALQAVLDRKPEVLMTVSEQGERTTRQKRVEDAATENSRAVARAQDEISRAQMEAENATRTQINNKRDISRKRITDQITTLHQSKNALSIGKSKLQASFSQRTFPLSAQDQYRQLKAFDDKSASIDAAIRELERELSEIQ